MTRLFNFKQFSLVYARSTNVKTVLFQTIPFSISTQIKGLKSSISSNSVYSKYTG